MVRECKATFHGCFQLVDLIHYGNDLCHVLQTCLSLQDSDVFYIPTSGLSGENLTTRSKVADLTAWYTGPCLLEQIGVCVSIFIFLCVLDCIQAKMSCTWIEYRKKYVIMSFYYLNRGNLEKRSFDILRTIFLFLGVKILSFVQNEGE